MTESIQKLKQAHRIMIGIVARRPDGPANVPIVLRLEKEISAREGVASDYQRIVQLASKDAA